MKNIFEAYKGIIYSIFLIIAAAAVIAVSGFIIVTPLWAVATKYKSLYTVAVFVIAAILVIYYLIIKIRKKQLVAKKITAHVFNFFLILLAAFLLLSAILLANNGFYIHSITIVVMIFLISGVIRYYFSRKSKNEFR